MAQSDRRPLSLLTAEALEAVGGLEVGGPSLARFFPLRQTKKDFRFLVGYDTNRRLVGKNWGGGGGRGETGGKGVRRGGKGFGAGAS